MSLLPSRRLSSVLLLLAAVHWEARIEQDVGTFLSKALIYALEDRAVTISLTLQDERVSGEVHASAPFLR